MLNPNPEDDEDVISECPIEEEENEEEVVVNPVEVEVVEHEFGVQKADIPLIVRQYPGLFFSKVTKRRLCIDLSIQSTTKMVYRSQQPAAPTKQTPSDVL